MSPPERSNLNSLYIDRLIYTHNHIRTVIIKDCIFVHPWCIARGWRPVLRLLTRRHSPAANRGKALVLGINVEWDPQHPPSEHPAPGGVPPRMPQAASVTAKTTNRMTGMRKPAFFLVSPISPPVLAN